jgi:hypothetical protein
MYKETVVKEYHLTVTLLKEEESLRWDELMAEYTVSPLICTLRNDFEGGRKVVLQTHIFFLYLQPEEKSNFSPS